MINEMWESFPRLLEQNIDELLDRAEPNSTKAFQLYKACQREDLWTRSFDEFRRCLEAFYAKPRFQRRKSFLDGLVDRPMPQAVYEDFHLNFRNGLVDERSVGNLVSWVHNLIRVAQKTTSVVISMDVLSRTMRTLVHPGPNDKAENIDFEDFCSAWTKTVFRLFGRQRDAELDPILKELRWLDRQLKEAVVEERDRAFRPTIYLTQTEIDWVVSVRRGVLDDVALPRFPLSRGAGKPLLMELERAACLYNIVRTTQLPELLRHRENIRLTILDRCDRLKDPSSSFESNTSLQHRAKKNVA